MTTRAMRWWVGVMLAALVLAGCGDGGETPAPDPTGAEPTETDAPDPLPSTADPAPGPTPWPEPTRPAAMDRDDIEGAKAAAEYFLELYPYVYASGDLSAWREISHPDCQFCSGVVNNVQELHSGGGYAEGPVLDVLAIDASSPDGDHDYYSVWIDAREGESTRYDKSGAVLERAEASLIEVDFALAWSEGRWLIRGTVGRDANDDESEV